MVKARKRKADTASRPCSFISEPLLPSQRVVRRRPMLSDFPRPDLATDAETRRKRKATTASGRQQDFPQLESSSAVKTPTKRKAPATSAKQEAIRNLRAQGAGLEGQPPSQDNKFTALITTCLRGWESVGSLLRCCCWGKLFVCAWLQWIDKEGKTPLMVAYMRPDLLSVAKVLIELGANVNACRPGSHCGTALHHAAKKGLEQTVHLLLTHGANPFIPNDDCDTALELAREEGHVNVVRAIELFVGTDFPFWWMDEGELCSCFSGCNCSTVHDMENLGCGFTP